jgi:hypothetical protein
MPGPKKGGRKAATDANSKVGMTLSPDSHKCLEILAKMGRYGSNKTAVATYLVTRALDDLTREGVLPRPQAD